ncbi:hypothetical protein [Oceanobacillus piezotolerans]|nr:hypothetical protein [Oceanobacillus piezotolerans]
MDIKERKKEEYFNLSKKDRLEFEMEEKEKQEKETAAEKVFDKLNEKYSK